MRSLAATLAALAGMLFLQAAIAFAPCGVPSRSAAMTRAVTMAVMPECHEADAANLCLAHCASEDQTLMKVPLDLPQLAAPAATPLPFVVQDLPSAKARPANPAAAGPPPRILFQTFLL